MAGALLGLMCLFISGTVLVAGFIVFIGGLISGKPGTKKIGINAMLVAVVGLLITYILCSIIANR